MNYQNEIVVDNFAGGGGASTGIEMAIGRSVDIAINHDPAAIAMHKVNHPTTKHYAEDVWNVDPVEACEGRPVGLAWFSPDCFPAGTLILTANGYRPIEEVSEGEMVLTHKGRWRPVTATMRSMREQVTVVGTGHYGIGCSKGHPFLIRHRPHKDKYYKRIDGEPEWKKAINLGKDDYWGTPTSIDPIAVPLLEKDNNKGNTLDVDERLLWLAGRYVGDGWLRLDDQRGEVVITCGNQDIEYLHKKLDMWPREGTRCKDGELSWYFRKVRTGGQFSCNNRALCKWLIDNFGVGSGMKTIPAWLYGADILLRKSFLDGYVTADGYIKDGLVSVSTISKRLAFGIKTLVSTLGFSPTVYYRSSEKISNKIEGREVNVKSAYIVKWREHIAEDHRQSMNDGRVLWQPIKEVIDDGVTGSFYNISVDEDESYVAEGIIVHNCTHFSKSRGGKPVEHHIRGLSWVVLRWAMTVRPRVMMMENVEEIQTWGPLITKTNGKQYPDPAHSGETFRSFIGMLTTGVSEDCPALAEACEFLKIDIHGPEAHRLIDGLGYDVQHRELVACDYGAPTSRKRFFLIARCDGKPIVWPKPTHGHPDSPEVKAGLKKPWVPVKTCIDFSLPCPSIFDSRQEIWDKYQIRAVRPLADATLDRIADGIRKFGSKPFLIQYHKSKEFRGQSLDRPLMTVDGSNRYGLVIAFLTSYYGNGSNSSVDMPMPTATGHDRFGLVQVMGDEYGISDICMRMLTPRELFDAQGFPDDYIIDVDADGNDYPRSEQVARCGNAVCPPVPCALVRANLPEHCKGDKAA